MNSLFLIIFISLLFWGIYQKWDDKKKEYIEHPIRTFLYFFFSTLTLIFIYPNLLKVFNLSLFSFVFFISIVTLTFLLYKMLKSIFIGPKVDMKNDHSYWKLLDQRYILPKLSEIFFQQAFFASVSLIIIEKYGLNIEIIIGMIFSFILAHVPLFFLQGKKIGLVYLLWSIIGAPIFSLIFILTNSIWYTASIHFLFYTILSLSTWILSGTKYSDN